MKQIKLTTVLIAMVVLFAGFCLGVMVGKNGSGEEFRIITERKTAQLQAPTQPTSEEDTTAPTSQVIQTEKESGQTTEAEAEPTLININTATVEELMKLPRIGPTLAQRIVEYREYFGPFESTKELDMVEGIGEKTIEDIIDLITVEE
ncbi:MAG: helix-hairpin-helix domain-containing protein [Ruminococcaceae bacterium]|nr:helix-hairpin-helix domain-containing protein [Oscillospiraceae bacterium]